MKIGKEWHYLDRAIDTEGKLVDVRLSKVRDLEATQAFFKQAVETVGHKPEQVTTDKETSYPYWDSLLVVRACFKRVKVVSFRDGN